jgi:hypothetical protein
MCRFGASPLGEFFWKKWANAVRPYETKIFAARKMNIHYASHKSNPQAGCHELRIACGDKNNGRTPFALTKPKFSLREK